MGLAIGFGVGIGLGPSGDVAAAGVDYIDQILGAGGLDYSLYEAKLGSLFLDSEGVGPVTTIGNTVGLWASSEKGRTLANSINGQPELKGSGAPAGVGSFTPATYDTTTGVGTAARTDVGNQSYVNVPVTLNKNYAIDIEVTSGTLAIRMGGGGAAIITNLTGPIRQTIYSPVNGVALTFAAANNASSASFRVHSVKLANIHIAKQPLTSFRPSYQANGLSHDGSDDNELSDWLMQAGANCMLLQVSVPATLSTTLVIAGTRDTAGSGLFWVGIVPSGNVNMALGSNTATLAAMDTRGTDVIIGLSCDGTTVKGFVNNAETYSAAQAGAPSTTVPIRLGAMNNNGVAASFWPGSIRRAAFGKKAITLAEFQQISNQWLAAA